MIISVYNEEKSIRKKLKNSLFLDYPKDKLEIIVASNGSTDNTNKIVSEYFKIGVKLNSIKKAGKTNAQNMTAPLSSGEIIVFSDANSIYDKQAIRKLIKNFDDKRVGLVHGRAVIQKANEGLVTKGVSLYAKYEDFIKIFESRLGHSITAYGGMLAIRRCLYEPIDVNFMEDFILPILTITKGYKSLFEHEALYYERGARNADEEFNTRARIITQDSLAFVNLIPKLLNSNKKFLIFQLISHKFLRWCIPFFLITLLILNIFLLNSFFYQCTILGQSIFYLFAFCGYIFYKTNSTYKIFYIPFYFCLVNGASLIGLVRMTLGKKIPTWNKSESTR